jgi:hypothetical protein
VLVLVPWTVRNVARFHAAVAVSNNLGTVLDGANCDLTYFGADIGAWRSTFAPRQGLGHDCFEGFAIADPHFDEVRAADAARRAGVHYAREHAGRIPVVALARVARTFGVWVHPGQQVNLAVLEGRDHRAEWAATAAEWALLVLAAWTAWVRRRDRAVWIALAAPVAVAVTTVLTYGNPRFRAGAEPTIIVLASVAVVALVAGRAPPAELTRADR